MVGGKRRAECKVPVAVAKELSAWSSGESSRFQLKVWSCPFGGAHWSPTWPGSPWEGVECAQQFAADTALGHICPSPMDRDWGSHSEMEQQEEAILGEGVARWPWSGVGEVGSGTVRPRGKRASWEIEGKDQEHG